MRASTLAVALALPLASAIPGNLPCDRELKANSSETIMFAVQTSDPDRYPMFEGKECGGTYYPGETLNVLLDVTGVCYALRVTGAVLKDSMSNVDASLRGEADCSSTPGVTQLWDRQANDASEHAAYVDTTDSTGTIYAWFGHAMQAGPVSVTSMCSLTCECPPCRRSRKLLFVSKVCEPCPCVA